MTFNHKLERMWKEAIVAYFKALTRQSPGDTKYNHKIVMTTYLVARPRFELGPTRIHTVLPLHQPTSSMVQKTRFSDTF